MVASDLALFLGGMVFGNRFRRGVKLADNTSVGQRLSAILYFGCVLGGPIY